MRTLMEEKIKENISELKKQKKVYCAWSNSCKNENKRYLCCSFCENKTCDSRCKDDYKTCKYLWTEDEHKTYHESTNNSFMKKTEDKPIKEKQKRRSRRSND